MVVTASGFASDAGRVRLGALRDRQSSRPNSRVSELAKSRKRTCSMLAIQIQAGILAVVWFGFAALNAGANGLLWGIAGGVIYAITHVIFVFVFDYLFYASLTGAVAANGIHFLSRMSAIIVGFLVCYFALKALNRRPSASHQAV
jgi:multisubunit Na+/H+ antiporter MnhB subunit